MVRLFASCPSGPGACEASSAGSWSQSRYGAWEDSQRTRAAAGAGRWVAAVSGAPSGVKPVPSPNS